MKKTFLTIAIGFLYLFSCAQIKTGTLQASGLTCSMCNLSILKSLETLSFIDSIVPNIETASYDLTFKINAPVRFEEIKRAVEKAGFSVAKLSFVVDMSGVKIIEDRYFTLDGVDYYIVSKSNLEIASTEISFYVTNKGYLSEKEYKKNRKNNHDETEKNIINISQF